MDGERKKWIFVIEDSKDLREMIQLFYEPEGYQVKFACDGKDALNQLRRFAQLPSIILLDLMMPVMDGFQFHRALLNDERLATIPTLAMTADASAKKKMSKMAFAGFLKKPLSVETLLNIAEEYCD